MVSKKKAPLHIAAEKGYEAIARALLKYGAGVNNISKRGMTPLHFAVTMCNKAVIKILLENSADINKICHFNNFTEPTPATPLCIAVKKGF